MDPVSWSCYINVHQAIPRGLGNKLDARLMHMPATSERDKPVAPFIKPRSSHDGMGVLIGLQLKLPASSSVWVYTLWFGERPMESIPPNRISGERDRPQIVGRDKSNVSVRTRVPSDALCAELVQSPRNFAGEGKGREEGKVWTPNFPLDGGVACGGPWARRYGSHHGTFVCSVETVETARVGQDEMRCLRQPSIASAMVGRRTKSVCPARPWTHRMDSARPPSEATDKGLGCKGARELVQDEDQMHRRGPRVGYGVEADYAKHARPKVASASGACKIACRRYACMPFHTDIKAC
ncbi:hypothetical protein J3E71DRAFT_242652 [Bipolaris maydis]|nr:hypothetical protein J3E71DRAFT_242652 [Bipolaris maydis]